MTDTVKIAGSLRGRLTWSLIAGSILLSVLFFVLVRSYAAQVAQEGQDNVLRASARSILDTGVLRDGQLEIDFPYAAFSMLNTPADDRVFYAIFQDGVLLSGYAELGPPPNVGDSGLNFADRQMQGAQVRVASAERVLLGADTRSTVLVSVAQTKDALSATLNRISRHVAAYGLGFFGLALALSFWVTAATIGPLQRLTQSVTRRGPQDLSPVAKPVPSEMGPLVASLNSLMARLNQSLSRSEEFIAEAAHRVRTPLATVRAHAEATLQRVDKEDNRLALRAMMRAIDESSRAAGQLLDHAMISFRADHLDRSALDLVELVADLLRRLTPLAQMKDIEIVLSGDASVMVEGDPILLENAIRNLIDNALKYAPSDSRIELRVLAGPRPRLEVRDEGPGFDPAEMAGLADRFARGQNAKGTIGSGLGLTIARDVALAHGGALHLENCEEGRGACVVLSL